MNNLEEMYRLRYEKILLPIAKSLELYLKDIFQEYNRIDRIVTRAKSINRFMGKANMSVNDIRKYTDPLNQIQDQVGARIVTYYKYDVEKIGDEISKYFRHIEKRNVIPDSESEFGYFGRHYILLFPLDVISQNESDIPPYFELQVKTLFQHSWSEANHDLGYKATQMIDTEIRRKIAYTSAQAWGADQIFNELFESLTLKNM